MTTEHITSLIRSMVEAAPKDRLGGKSLSWQPVQAVNMQALEHKSPTEEYSSKEDDE